MRIGDGAGEAYTVIVRGGLLSHEILISQRPRFSDPVEGNMCGAVMRGADALLRSNLNNSLGDFGLGVKVGRTRA